MVNQLSPLEALSYVQQQGEMGRQRGQQNQLAQLASQSYTAPAEQQNALLGQMAAINPQAAQATQQQFQGQEDRRLQKLAGAARYLEQARQTNNPQAVQGAWNAVRPMLAREMPQGQFPEQWDDATMAPTLYQVLAQTGGGAQGNVQSVRIGEDGYYYNVMRDGRVVNTGIKSSPNIKVLEQEGQLPIGVVTSNGVAGQTIPVGGGQPQATQAQPPGAYIDPSLPPQVQAQIRQSLASGQEPPAQMVFNGQPSSSGGVVRTPTSAEKAAADAAARRQVELSTLPAELGMRTNAAIQQAGGTAEATNAAKTRAELQATQAERQRSAQDTLSLLDQAEQILPNATGGRGGQFVDAAAGLIGASTPGAQATAQLQTIAGQLTSKMPRMQGPQSDRDVQLYQQMAGDLANPSIPVETRMAALQTIRQLNQKYANGGAQSQPPAQAGGSPVRVQSASDYNALPSGASYYAPDGTLRRKQ